MSDLSEKIVSVRGLARAVGRSHTAVAGWLRHPEWAFAPAPPWDFADVPRMREWARDTLREDRGPAVAPEGGFWGVMTDYPPLLIARCNRLPPLPTRDVRKLPAMLASPFERDVIAGKRTMSAADAAEYVAHTVRLKVILADEIDHWAACVAGRSAEEVRRRLRSLVYQRLDWFAAAADAQAKGVRRITFNVDGTLRRVGKGGREE
jgi:hypothetical protein